MTESSFNKFSLEEIVEAESFVSAVLPHYRREEGEMQVFEGNAKNTGSHAQP